MRTRYNHIATTTLFGLMLTLAPACGGNVESDATAVHGRSQALQGDAEFDVEVRFAGGLTRADAESLLSRIEILPTRELFPELDLSHPWQEDESPVVLDGSEPTFEVVLHPLNFAAEQERYSWRLPTESKPTQTVVVNDDGTAKIQQGIEADVAVAKYLDPGESWRTARHRCYAPFVFIADVAGPSKVCIDLGAEGKAGSNCSYAWDPREPVIVAHPGPDANPFNKHYFRGRVTGLTLAGYGLPTFVAFAGYACL